MTDDLLKRLWESRRTERRGSEMTDEELLHREYEKLLRERIEELEAKLARAVEMLDRLSFARTTLAEMKEEDRG